MKAEIISVGTELLLGQLVDTNSVWLSQQLSMLGIDSHFKTTVGDNAHNIQSVFALATERADIIIATGGLGPTQDDITKETLATTLGLPLVYDEALAEMIREKFASRNITMSENNYRQAHYPQGCQILEKYPGTAPGLYLNHEGKHYFLLPGVPYEMKAIFDASVVPILRQISPDNLRIYTEVLKLWGLPESHVAERLSDLDDRLAEIGNPKLSYLASGINGISVRISAKAADEKAAQAMIAPYQKEAEEILAPYIFGHNQQTMERCVLKLCAAQDLTLGCVEWFTAGMMASRLTAYGENLEPFKGGMVLRGKFDQAAFEAAQETLNVDIVLGVSENFTESTTVYECQLHLCVRDQYFSKIIQIPKHQREEAMAFAVINCFNFLKNQLQTVEK
ncbi:competence/damage-inducible protein A [Wohlfahrtiimonas chitiniclastica]|uniref:CinA family nicotinamide mononucleotide deamidase-related protein n=1 Tax=Wohlfahrtiimonas chitiniclastica TaxID=400946 RepID=UPI000B980D8A|nr:CinA family nicotinamide mononucleotide deamidase-related protein [Wohlfahrtiimonas chitiniclastica]OYQ69537.1 competence/damage-inducible protein A [Wohlfahrtiimonas chitiniclastica]OYQ80945.1 competence/damage-inducible protein A [Wohlfahrtiimonas chitiniclastica]OYQ85701.1 competence/damage-inducible protein A [Wohlfahrtiimonas chitiniclastica]OYQ86063.1 competence/damage-inducible protein A [Wohlfahrtiimonas chitiniclastica]